MPRGQETVVRVWQMACYVTVVDRHNGGCIQENSLVKVIISYMNLKLMNVVNNVAVAFFK